MLRNKISSRQSGKRQRTSRSISAPRLVVGSLLLLAAFVWAYWTTLTALIRDWQQQPDYSHGFVVVPLAALFLWLRRDHFPKQQVGPLWIGLLLIAGSIALRWMSSIYYMQPVDGWSILLWCCGAAWVLGGMRFTRWCLPSIAFLFFMVPLPYRAERWMRVPLQRLATETSCWCLQALGQPALAEGNTILLGQQQLEVDSACSGLRIFSGIVALAMAYVLATRRPWWEKAVLLASSAPIALIANSFRIVATGLLYEYASNEAAAKFNHDLAGWLMIPFAALLFGALLWYLGKLMREIEPVHVGQIVRR